MPVMSRNPINRVREFLLTRDLEGLSDAELLSRFADRRDEDSFTTLVRRHTPLVLGTARRIVANASDADDVFQAAFLTLARKSGSIRCDGTLAPWLHRVTWRLAVRARKRSRPAIGEPRPAAAAPDPLSQITGRELYSVIDEELARLSAGLRATVVLCCLQGLSRDEAATRLGWSTATVKRRLAKARAILERRLSARGITLSAALAPVLVAADLPATAASHVLGATVDTAMGRASLPSRVAGLCGSSAGHAKSWLLVAGAGVLAAGLVWGLQPAPKPTPSEPPARTELTKGDERPAADVGSQHDPLPPGAVARIGTTRFRHDEWLSQALWSPDGKYIASTAGETLIIWQADSGKELARLTLEGPAKPAGGQLPNLKFVRDLHWSRDGRTIFATIHGWSTRCSWDPDRRDLRFVQNWESPEELLTAAISAEGSRIFSASAHHASAAHSDSARIWPATIAVGATITGAVVSPTEELAVIATSGSRTEMQVFDMRWREPAIATFDRSVSRMAFSEDGKSFAAVTEVDDKAPVIELWDTTTWKSRKRILYPHAGDRPAEIRALALSPDGKTFVTGGGDKTLRWWDTTTGKETRKIGPGWVYYNKATFRPDGKVLMTVSHENHVRLWDVETGNEKSITSGPGWGISAATFTPDGKRVYSVSEHTTYAHDAATGRELWRGDEHTDSAVQVAVTPDGKTVITSSHDGTLIFREADTGKITRQIENLRHSADMLTLSPDGRTVYALGSEGAHDGVILGWDVATGKPHGPASLPAKPERYAAYSIRYAPDGSGIAVASGTELRVPVFDPVRKELRASFGKTDGGVSCAEYSPDGRMIAAGTLGDSIYVWETATGQTRGILKEIGGTTCLAFSPDGRILAVVNSGQRHVERQVGKIEEVAQDPAAIRLLDTYTGREFHRFRGHTGSVYRLAWTADGRRLLSGSHDSSCLIWDVAAVRGKLQSADIDAKDAAKAVEELRSASAQDAFKAMARLTGSPKTAVPALRGLLRPVQTVDPERVAELIRDLDKPQFATRDRAAAELVRMGEGAEGLLQKALDGKLSPEARDRVEKVLGELKPATHRLRLGRALEVLQQMADGEARKVLTELARGAEGAWLTREAEASLVRSPN